MRRSRRGEAAAAEPLGRRPKGGLGIQCTVWGMVAGATAGALEQSRLRCPRGKRGRQAKILSTMHKVHGSEKQVWSREQGNERLTHEWA